MAQTQTGPDDGLIEIFAPSVYDTISLTYSGEDLTLIEYKTGGVSGSVVGTVTLSYSSGRLVTITRV